MPEKLNFRVAAIVRNEAPYLAEWIAHYSYSGFTTFHLMLNQIDDETLEVAQSLNTDGNIIIEFVDHLFDIDGTDCMQHRAYRLAFTKARDDGVTAILFCDIDEFLCNASMTQNVHQLWNNVHPSLSILFPWAALCHDVTPFSRMHDNLRQDLPILRHYKALSGLSIVSPHVTAHIIRGKQLRHNLAGSVTLLDDPIPVRLESAITRVVEHKYVMVHRMWRSPVEYVIRLTEGTRQDQYSVASKSPIKTNRLGYNVVANPHDQPAFRVVPDDLAGYAQYIESIARRIPRELSNRIFSTLTKRFYKAVDALIDARRKQPATLNRLLQGLDSEFVLEEPDQWLLRHGGPLRRPTT